MCNTKPNLYRSLFILAFFGATQLFTGFALKAQIPAGYYANAENKSGAALKTALHDIIKNHTSLSYSGIWSAFGTTDRLANGKINDIYSSKQWTFSSQQCGTYSKEGDCYNREHSFPKSWFNDATPMHNDLFHVYPSDGYVNGIRGNLTWGEVGAANYTSTNGCKRGINTFPGYSGTVFEPADEYKGDLARTYFYMATRYENLIAGWKNNDNDAKVTLSGNAYPAYQTWFINLLAKWHNQDPVSQREIDRNNAIYAIQGNRNPFIDHPHFAGLIWNFSTTGTNTGINPPSTSSGSNVLGSILVYSQKFDVCTSCGWASIGAAANSEWQCSSGAPEVNAYKNITTPGTSTEVWLVSPKMRTTVSGAWLVDFKSYTKFYDTLISARPLELLYSTNYSPSIEISHATWHTIAGIMFPEQNTQFWMPSGIGTITGVSHQNVYFAFRYRSSGNGPYTSTYWSVDDFTIHIAGHTTPGIVSINNQNATLSTIPSATPLSASTITVGGVQGVHLKTNLRDKTNGIPATWRFSAGSDITENLASITLYENGTLSYLYPSTGQLFWDEYFYEVCDAHNRCAISKIYIHNLDAFKLKDTIITTKPNMAGVGNLSGMLQGTILSDIQFVTVRTTLGLSGRFQLQANGNFTLIPETDFEGAISIPVKACRASFCFTGNVIFDVKHTTPTGIAADGMYPKVFFSDEHIHLQNVVPDLQTISLIHITGNELPVVKIQPSAREVRIKTLSKLHGWILLKFMAQGRPYVCKIYLP